MIDRTAMTEPLTIGQQLVARWEGPSSGWSEPADLAEAIDAAIAAEIERLQKHGRGRPEAVKPPRNPSARCTDCGSQHNYTDYYDVCYNCGRNVSGYK